jgi:hypothetical protein
MEVTVSTNPDIDSEQLADFSRALRDYQTTGTKQCLSILNILMESNISINQLKESKIGACLSKIAKEEYENADDKQLKKAAIQLFKKCKQREEKNIQNENQRSDQKKSESSPHSSTEARKFDKEENKPLSPNEEKQPLSKRSSLIEENKGSSDEKKSRSDDRASPNDIHKSYDPSLQRKISTDVEMSLSRKTSSMSFEFETTLSRKASTMSTDLEILSLHRKTSKDHRRNSQHLQKEVLPPVTQEYKNFALKAFTDGLLIDFKGNPQEKEKRKPKALEKATEIEKALSEKTKGNDNEYRLEARNLSNFLMLKNNEELRRRLMDDTAECKEFVNNKENFLNQSARDRIEEASRRLIEANNADYDKKLIR